MTLSTCSAGTNYDTKLSVFSGSCGSLVCIDGDDDHTCTHTNLHSEVSFAAVSGTTYYVLVHGFGSANGDFDLLVLEGDISCAEIPTMSEWGLIFMSILLLTLAAVGLRKRSKYSKALLS